MFISCLLGFVAGITLGSFLHFPPIYFLVLFFIFLIFFIYRYFVFNEDRKNLTIITIFIFALILGIIRINYSKLYSQSELSFFENKKVTIIGFVVDEPDVREKNTKLSVLTKTIVYGDKEYKLSEKILVTVPLYPEFHYGDEVRGNIVLVKPENFDTGQGRIFNYEGYLRVRGIWYTTKFSTMETLSGDNGNYIKSLLFKTKNAFTDSIQRVLPQPESSLLSGLLLGVKQSLGNEILTEFQRTGTSHIVVLSGYNISIVAQSIISTLGFLPKLVSLSFGIIGIVLFIVLSGGGASAFRAGVMVITALIAKNLNRDYKASRVLGFAILIMLAPNPLLLVFDPSFQLSILATIGLVFVSPIISKYFESVTDKFGLREILATTISTQLTVLPFLIYNTGLVSLVSLPVNILILGTIPTTMFLGFLTGLLGSVNFYLSIFPAFLTYGLLWYQLKIVHLGSSFSFGAITLPTFSSIYLLIIYSIIFYILYRIKNKISF